MELSRPPFAVTASPTSQCIMGCKSAVQLGALVMEHGGTFDHTASAAAMWKLQTIVNGPIDQSGRSSEVEALEQLLQLMLTHLKSMGSRHVTTILQSLARLAYWDEAVLDSILQHSARILASFSPPCLVGTIWSLATLGHQSAAGFVTSLLLKARSRIKEFTPLNLGLMLWSMAVLDIEESRCIREFLYHALKLSQGPNLEMQIHQQLLSTMSWIKDRQVDLTEKYQAIVADIIQTSSSALAVSPQSVPTVSRVQEDVLSVVRSLPGCQAKGNVELEHLTADGLHSIDIALMLPSRTHIAIEVDGPMHFLACKDPSTGRLVLNGRTKLRNRLLEARGWRVLSVPVQEWCGIVTERERRAYLEDRLRKLGGLGGDEPKGRAGGAATCLAPQSSTKDQRKGKAHKRKHDATLSGDPEADSSGDELKIDKIIKKKKKKEESKLDNPTRMGDASFGGIREAHDILATPQCSAKDQKKFKARKKKQKLLSDKTETDSISADGTNGLGVDKIVKKI